MLTPPGFSLLINTHSMRESQKDLRSRRRSGRVIHSELAVASLVVVCS